MKSYLKGLFPSATIPLVFFLSACDFAPSSPAEPAPNLHPTVEAPLAQNLAKERKLSVIGAAAERESSILNVGLVPTPTPTGPWVLAVPSKDSAKLARCAGENPSLKVLPSLVEIRALKQEGAVAGSGFIVDGERGFILTTTHLVSDVERDTITVTYRNGVTAEAIWLAHEPSADISLLYSSPSAFPALRIPSDIKEALAESNGRVISERISELVAIGVVDGSYLTVKGETLSLTVDNAGWPNVTVGTPIEPGMSGGPLVDQCGNLVGILSLGNDGQGTLTAIGLNQSRLAALMREATSFLQGTPTPAHAPTLVAQPKQPITKQVPPPFPWN